MELGDELDFVKVLDFGVAKLHGAQQQKTLTQVGMIFGTPTYMSPEQARCQTLDARSDIYALGVLMYEMLIGKCPFTAEEPVGLLLKHVTEPPPPFNTVRPELQVPAALEALVMKALEKDRDHRFQSADEMANQLEAVAHDLQITYGTSVLPTMLGATPRTPVPGVPSTDEVLKTQAADFLGIGDLITERDTMIAQLGDDDLFTDARRPEPEEAGLTPRGGVGWNGDLRLDLSSAIPPREVARADAPPKTLLFLGGGVAILIAFVAVVLIAVLGGSDAPDTPPQPDPGLVAKVEPDLPLVDNPVVDVPDVGVGVDGEGEAVVEGPDAAGTPTGNVEDAATAPAEIPSGDDGSAPAAQGDEGKKNRGDKEPDRRDRAETFTLTVTTVPPGASIYEGSTRIGASPASLTGKGGSILDVVVSMSGYETFRKPVPLTKNGSIKVTLKANKAARDPGEPDVTGDKPPVGTRKPDKPTGDEIPEDVYGDP
jgi:hypothetical protein